MCVQSMKERMAMSEWQPFQKRHDYQVGWYRDDSGVTITNKLEGVTYETSPDEPIVLTGTVGEQWIQSEEKFRKTYNISDEDFATGAGQVSPKPNGDIIWARPAVGQERVVTNWGHTLTANRDGVEHGKGDMVVCSDDNGKPNPSDSWVVNGAVWENTYKEAEVEREKVAPSDFSEVSTQMSFDISG